MRHISNRKARSMVGIATGFLSRVPSLVELRNIGDPAADAAIKFFRRETPKGSLERLAHNLVGFQFAADIGKPIEQFAQKIEATQFVIEMFADDGLAIDPDRPSGVQAATFAFQSCQLTSVRGGHYACCAETR